MNPCAAILGAHCVDGNGDRRLDMWVSTEAYLALARLARRYSVTKRQVLERLIVRADDLSRLVLHHRVLALDCRVSNPVSD